MATPLDGTAFYSYARRLHLSQATQDLLVQIRSSPPSRTPRARRGNMPVWYPSKKMHCIIKAESSKVEFPFLLAAEHDDNVVEFWDQPPSIRLEYRDARGHRQRPLHTADYFVFRYHECGWVECKPAQELIQQAERRPNRYVQDAHGVWRCPPGEAFAAQYGLTYRVWSSEEINWAIQDNALFLEDYYHDLERLHVPTMALEVLYRLVDEQPGIFLADLQEASALSRDLINITIAKHALYVDLATHRLSAPWRTPVFRTRGQALSYAQREAHETVALASAPVSIASLTPAGQALLERASDLELATAVFRNRVIHPEDYHDQEQSRTAAVQAAIHPRTKQRWQQRYHAAETQLGSGFLGLLPCFHNCGGTRKIDPTVLALIHQVLETHYDTTTRKPKRGAYGEYLKCSEEQHLHAVSQRTFYAEAQRHKPVYEQTMAREGFRAAYPFKDYVHAVEKTVNQHGNYNWAMAHLDHTEVNLLLRDSRMGQLLGKCWLTLLILAHPRRIAAYYLTFDPPSYRSCLAVLRLCVKRYGRLPAAITVDGGAEFESVYFEHLLALYRVRKHQRPTAEPRFGSPQERLFGSMETEFLYHLLGNTQATQQTRLVTTATDPRRQAVWTLPAFAARLRQWADEEYDTLRHPSLGVTPREAYALSLERDGERAHKQIAYDDTFLKATFPSTRKGTAKVVPGVGVRMNYLDYWCEAMRDPTVENTQVLVRYDPFDVSIGYAYIQDIWRTCVCPYTEFASCSERELQLLTEELRKRNHLSASWENVEITQKQLAAFRRDNDSVESLLRQQWHDRETRAALKILEGGQGTPIVAEPVNEDVVTPPETDDTPEENSRPYDNLLVFKRIRL
jgi:putative transposase